MVQLSQDLLIRLTKAEDTLRAMTCAEADTRMGVMGDTAVLLSETREALRHSGDERYRSLIGNLPMVAFEADFAGKIVRISDATTAITGYDPHDIIGKETRQVFGPAFSAAAIHERARRHGDDSRFEHGLTTKSGSHLQLQWNFMQLSGADETFGSVVGMATDITGRRRSRKKLQESQTHLLEIMNNVQEAIVTIDKDGTVESFNRTAERIFGYSECEVLGKNIDILFPKYSKHTVQNYIERHFIARHATVAGPETREVTGRRRDGLSIQLDLAVSEIHVGENRRFIGTMRDISRRKSAAKHLRNVHKMEAVVQLTGGIAHDFNNFLAVVLGNLEILKSEFGGNQLALEPVHTAMRAAQGGASLAKRLLAYSRRQVLEPEHLDLNDFISGMEALLHAALGDEIAIEMSFGDDRRPAFVDRTALETTLINLALNAHDAMAEGGTLTIETAAVHLGEGEARDHPDAVPGDYVKVSVTDTGTGIAPEVMEHVLEPFFTTKESDKGTGLGLSMIYGFVKQSGGYLTLDSAFGLGTTVNLFFPEADETIDLIGKPYRPEEPGRAVRRVLDQ